MLEVLKTWKTDSRRNTSRINPFAAALAIGLVVLASFTIGTEARAEATELNENKSSSALTDNGEYKVTANITINIDGDKTIERILINNNKTLTITGDGSHTLTIANGTKSPITINPSGTLAINSGNVELNYTGSSAGETGALYGHATNTSVNISGGTLKATSINGAFCITAVNIDIKDAEVTAEGGDYGLSVHTGGSITMKNATVKATAKNYGGIVGGDITIDGGTVTAKTTDLEGIYAKTLDIKNANVTATSASDVGIKAKSSITIKNSTVKATGAGEYNSGIFTTDGDMTISDSTVTATTSGTASDASGIYVNGALTISGSDTVVTASTKGTNAITANGGITLNDPLAVTKPENGDISSDKTYIVTSSGDKTKEAEIKKKTTEAEEEEEKKEEEEEKKDEESASESSSSSSKRKAEHKTASWVLNPNEKQQLVATGQVILGGYKAGYQEQGELGKLAFRTATPAGWTEAFSFNLLKDGKPDFTLKSGTFTLLIPSQYQKAGRQFALLALDKSGKVYLLPDTDTNPNTITVAVNLEGYTFELLYKD